LINLIFVVKEDDEGIIFFDFKLDITNASI